MLIFTIKKNKLNTRQQKIIISAATVFVVFIICSTFGGFYC